MTAKEKYHQLLNLAEARNELTKQIDSVRKQIAAEISPYEVGKEYTIKGYSHEGKTGRITSINFRIDGYDKADLQVFATVLKKDGSISANRASWSAWQDENLQTAVQSVL